MTDEALVEACQVLEGVHGEVMMEVRWDHAVGPWAGAGAEVTQAHTGMAGVNWLAYAQHAEVADEKLCI